jgi:hypothetical protein
MVHVADVPDRYGVQCVISMSAAAAPALLSCNPKRKALLAGSQGRAGLNALVGHKLRDSKRIEPINTWADLEQEVYRIRGCFVIAEEWFQQLLGYREDPRHDQPDLFAEAEATLTSQNRLRGTGSW